LGVFGEALKDLAGNKFAVVEPSVENVNITYESFLDPKYGLFRDEYHSYGINFLDTYYGHIFGTVATHEELSERVDWTKSAGYTAGFYKILTKGELIRDTAYMASEYNLKPTTTIPLTSVANKRELKEIEDIKKGKIRCFFVAEWVLVKLQIKYGLDSAKKLMMLLWSAYGFSPFRGGTHSLAKKLIKKPVRFFYDVSGWDKFVPLMKDLYSVIFRHTNLPLELEEEFLWVVKHTCEFWCVLFDGDVIVKPYGNCSGSGMTTRDNTLMHVIIAAGFLSKAYFEKIGVLPPLELVAEQIVRLFGDDSLFAVDEEFSYVLNGMGEEDGFLSSFFKKFGMKLKFLKGGYNYPITKMEFLGFRFEDIDGKFFPYYDPVKSAHSFYYTNDKNDSLSAYVSKCFVLTIMSYATEHRDLFLKAYTKLIDSIEDRELTPELRSFKFLGRLNDSILRTFYSGEESSIDFTFFYRILEAEGRKDDVADQGSD